MPSKDQSVGRGDDPSFRQQVVALLPKLRRFARGLTGNAADADDLVQTACLKAIERAHQWTDGTRLDSWMYRIVHNQWLDDLRARKVRAVDAEADPDSLIADDGVARTEANITLDAVRKAMLKLPGEQRAVLALVCIEGLAYKDAADALGVPIGTVMSRLARARQALGRATGLSRAEGESGNVVKLV